MRSPFPYFGGKAWIAADVWERLGPVPNYVEPFAGSLAVLLARPDSHRWWEGTETVNDADGMISNFWRAVQAAPAEVAHWADWPVSENDLHARHLWLLDRKLALTARLEGDPAYFDAQVAGWWVWGMCCWIGSGFCSGEGPWMRLDGELRKLPHLGDAGRGIHRKLPHLGDAGRGIHRKLPHLGNAGRGNVAAWTAHLEDMMEALADRLRRVRICSGDWSRVCGPTPTTKLGLTGIFLDPPYSHAEREPGLYAHDEDIAMDVRRWAITSGRDPDLRIVLCGYDGEHEMPADWERLEWKARGGYGSQGEGRGRENAEREVLWFSPHCLHSSCPRQEFLL